ncbi:MAG: prephenate dehydrogenase [Anaerolineae bacterium]|nr:prephenate dehydrogenase [Anaerolineae bacterium]
MEGQITIVGLGAVGCSIGLALRAYDSALEVVGYDADGDHARQAAAMGAVHKTVSRLPAACKEADMVVLSLPLPVIRRSLETVAPHLPAGCIVTDTAVLKVPVLAWARQYLPEQAHYVAGMPIPGPKAKVEEPLAGPEMAQADLFQEGLYCVASTGDTEPAAVKALLNLAQAIGARPYFLDPLEYDGLQAGTADLPALIAMAFLNTMVDSAGWRDLRKIAGYDFAAITGLVAGDPQERYEAALFNRENLLLRLDLFLQELARLRQLLRDGDQQSLTQAYAQAAQGRGRWLHEKATGDWGDLPEVEAEIPSAGEQFGQMMFGGLFRRRRPPEDDS